MHLLAALCGPSQRTRPKLRHFLPRRPMCMIGDLGPVEDGVELGSFEVAEISGSG